ncbi:laccase family multicopper oxidase [Syntrophotalea carbinolica DSM 2380]|uniref:Purine nucleoside phosphorylase n=1 Tax=Syntrophotalea carbinolica (strain DSM 2380 / NBRC 103641 / GraBd1) TaxID=338963 RepID=Q3A0C1_SYNC1|nr:peptidoglycan editing factor PgeF [Syntrophotalea carbinolica]ABA90186.1 laccase family multicopper oxidase [Syntrophotalea carbinolica DSM 2380]
MKLVRKGKISYMQPDWAIEKPVEAGFTTRNGGISRPPYNSLNLGYNTEDAPHNVEGNRSNLTRAFDLHPHQLLTVKQVHGNDILIVDQPNHDLSHFLTVASDAIVTNQPGFMFGVLVADCFPVLLHDPTLQVGAAIHLGWRGAANCLLGKTVEAMQSNFGCRPENLSAAVGPGIAAHHYEVDRTVRDAFRQGSGHWPQIASETALGKWQLDLQRSCLLQLEDVGIQSSQISMVEECTCCHRELFFSHRRDNGATGRQLGFMIL